jgi:competence protein ComEA
MQEWNERAKQLFLVALVAVGVGGAALVLDGRAEMEPLVLEVPTPHPTLTVIPTGTPAPVVVFVSGAVAVPGVYTLPPGSRVVDALQAAGGPLAEAAIERLNQAVLLTDGMQIHMPLAGEGGEIEAGVEPEPPLLSPPPLDSTGGVPAANEAAPVSINRASTAELESLPGIGPTLAQRIVDYREANGPFTSIEQLTEVKGIGEATLDELRPYIALE